MKYKILPYSPNDEKEWDSFVENHKKATVFHTMKWKNVLEETFKYKSEYLLIKDPDERLIGISPSFSVKKLFGKVIVSQPFFEYGGPLIETGFDDALNDILKFNIKKVDENKLKYMEIKLLPDGNDECYIKNGFCKQLKGFNFYIDIKDKDFENDIWMGLYNNKVRNSIRHGIKSGLRIIQEENTNIYYNLYLKTMTKLGSPPYPKILFENIKKYLGTSVRFTFAYMGEIPIAGLCTLIYNNRVLIIGNVSDPNYRYVNANDVLYNEQIKNAILNKFDTIDFGRTRPNSSYESFKKKWGATRTNMYSYVYPLSEEESANPYKYYLMFSKITKKIPWIFTKTGLGQYIIKKFP